MWYVNNYDENRYQKKKMESSAVDLIHTSIFL